MRLTQENAHQYVDKLLDAHKRRFHYYPLKVRKANKTYMVIDNNGVSYDVPEADDRFNSIYFDIVSDENDLEEKDGGE